MSVIKQLETIGANATTRYNTEKTQLSDELQTLIDTCPDIIAFLAPAEEEDQESKDDENDQPAPQENESKVG